MILVSLSLSCFRNFSDLDLSCAPGMSVFLGENAQGKSNLLEAIYFLSTGRSFRTNRLLELVQWGREHFQLCASVEFSGVSHRIEATVGTRQSRYLLDGKPRRAAGIFGNFKAVIFANEDLDVVRQEPATRRKFFDLFFSQVDWEYGRHLEDFTRVIKSRNSLLKAEQFDQMDVWDELLVREGSWLIGRRKSLLADFERIAATHHAKLSGLKEKLRLLYKTSGDGDSQEAIGKALEDKLAEHREHERILKTTLVGPHRDDFEIRIGEKALRHFGSEGQKRSTMLSLRLAQWKFLGDQTGESPMILLDDVLGELDEDRQDAFLDLVVHSGAQTFIALTQARDSLRSVARSIFYVSAGAVAQNERTATT